WVRFRSPPVLRRIEREMMWEVPRGQDVLISVTRTGRRVQSGVGGLSAIRYRLSAIRYRLSAIGYPLSDVRACGPGMAEEPGGSWRQPREARLVRYVLAGRRLRGWSASAGPDRYGTWTGAER